jgi:hypothetical protein
MSVVGPPEQGKEPITALIGHWESHTTVTTNQTKGTRPMSEVTTKALDGILLRGQFVECAKVVNTETGEVYDNLANATFITSRGEQRLTAARYDSSPLSGRVELPAFQKLLNAEKGQIWEVSLAVRKETEKEATDPRKSRYVNFTAIDAELIEPATDTQFDSPRDTLSR